MTAVSARPALDGHAAAIAGLRCRRVDDDGRLTRLPVRRWHGGAERALRRLADRCTGPTLDVGCGPGRLTAELATRGVRVLGIDTCAAAVLLTRRRGVEALERSVFDRLPDEGGWRQVLLTDGNIGISGDPVALLRRCAGLLHPDGAVLAEVDPPGNGLWSGRSRLRHRLGETAPFAWARVGLDALPDVVDETPLVVRAVLGSDGRWFVELVPT